MTGDRGWIQITNFVVTGVLMLASAAGLRRTLEPGLGSSWGPLLMVAYGLGLICTGVFVTDPQLGFPPGTPKDLLPGVNAEASWHGNVHTVSVLFMYVSLTAACFVFARRFAAEPGGRWWATSLVATGVAAPTVLIVGAFVLQTFSLSSQWIAVADGVAGRVIIRWAGSGRRWSPHACWRPSPRHRSLSLTQPPIPVRQVRTERHVDELERAPGMRNDRRGSGVSAMVRQHWKPALLLMVLSPLAEVISGATPATLFFMPWIFLPYATLLYGFPVLVIREVAVRRKLGVLGLWCLGLLYALYNEGLRAATLFYPLDVPLDTFSTYGLVADVRVPFTIWISFWHGLFSVVIPVLFVEYLFRKKADEPWLPVKATWSLAILSVGTAIAYFLFVGEASTTQDATTLIVHFAFLVVATLVLWFVAGRLPRTPRIVVHGGSNGFRWKPFFSGVGLYLFLSVVPEFLAQDGIPPLVFALYFAVLAVVAGWAIARRWETTRAQVVVFLLGSGTAQASLAAVFGVLIGNIMWSISGVIFTAIFLGALVRIRRKSMAVLDGREA